MDCADQADCAPFACQKHLKTLSLSRDKTISLLLRSTTESISAMDCRKESSHLSMTFYLWQRIRCKPTNLCKLGNYQSGPLDADPINRVEGLKCKKKRLAGGGSAGPKILRAL